MGKEGDKHCINCCPNKLLCSAGSVVGIYIYLFIVDPNVLALRASGHARYF